MSTNMNALEFFARYPVFTYPEFTRYAISQGSTNFHTHAEILAYHLKKKNIIRIRRGFFASVPLSSRNVAKSFYIDPYLIASRISDDAILAYHSAFDFYGLSYSLYYQFTFLSQKKIRPFVFEESNFICLPHPKALLTQKNENTEIVTINRQGLDIKVTSIERTIVDVLDNPNYGGGFEEIWRTAEHIPILNFDKMIDYALLLDNVTTMAKVGFFLEQHKEKFNVSEDVLVFLETKKPKNTHYIERSRRESGKFIRRWNLVISDYILEKKWEEPKNDFI